MLGFIGQAYTVHAGFYIVNGRGNPPE